MVYADCMAYLPSAVDPDLDTLRACRENDAQLN